MLGEINDDLKDLYEGLRRRGLAHLLVDQLAAKLKAEHDVEVAKDPRVHVGCNQTDEQWQAEAERQLKGIA